MLLPHRSTKKSSALRFIKFSLVFNPHFLIVFVLATCNTFLHQTLFEFCRIGSTSEDFRQKPSKAHPSFHNLIPLHPVYVWSLVGYIHNVSFFTLLTSWSTVCKRSVFLQFCDQSNQACTKYLPRYIQQFLYDRHTLRVSQSFHKPRLKGWFPAFHCKTFSLCCLPSFSSWEHSYPLLDSQKT